MEKLHTLFNIECLSLEFISKDDGNFVLIWSQGPSKEPFFNTFELVDDSKSVTISVLTLLKLLEPTRTELLHTQVVF